LTPSFCTAKHSIRHGIRSVLKKVAKEQLCDLGTETTKQSQACPASRFVDKGEILKTGCPQHKPKHI
jgi:hypothetical protein